MLRSGEDEAWVTFPHHIGIPISEDETFQTIIKYILSQDLYLIKSVRTPKIVLNT